MTPTRLTLAAALPLCAALALASPARATMPLSVGGAPPLLWGDHVVALQGGWPVEAVSLAWGTRTGWNPGLFASLDLTGPDQTWAAGASFTRPLGHTERASGFFHLAGSPLLQRRFPGGPTRFGGEWQTGLSLGVGLGVRRHVTFEVGFASTLRLGPGLVHELPRFGVLGSMGWTFYLSSDVSVGVRGRGGVSVRPDDPLALDWGAGLVLSRLF